MIVVGGGFAGLSAACFLAKEGKKVTLIEKNDSLGGRCRAFKAEGFTFDMGPSWYWMPDVFERFYNFFGYKTSDFYELIRLDPSYQVIYSDGDVVSIPADYQKFRALFESFEAGSGKKLDKFLADAKYKYDVGLGEFVHKPSLSVTEFMELRIARSFFKMDMFSSISKEVRRKFSHPKLIELLEFPVLFLGAKPQDTPALYSLMNYADIKLGTWYPMGGMAEIPKAMVKIASELGVTFKTGEAVTSFEIEGDKVNGVTTTNGYYKADQVISSADYHHSETSLLSSQYRSYKTKYWDSRVMAPSSLLFYIGVNRRVDQLLHHNLFFDTDFGVHAQEIYDHPKWPDNPLFYVCCPSKTDSSVAPEGMENIFALVPIAAGLKDDTRMHEEVFQKILRRLHTRIGEDISDSIIYKRTFCLQDFKNEYNSFKGNAYGLANTLLQTAFLKPRMRSKKVKNLLFAGQLTTPGPGVPPSLISGEVAANYLLNHY